MKPNPKAITLVELMIGLVLLGLVVLGLSNIEVFSRNVFFNIDKRVKVQNDVSYVLQHMQKYVAQGISDPSDPAKAAIIMGVGSYAADKSVKVWIDSNHNGFLDDDCSGGDVQIAYYYNNYGVYYNNNYTCSGSPERLAANISYFNVTRIFNNTLGVVISGCANASDSASCGVSRDNPRVNLTTKIILPSVSLE